MKRSPFSDPVRADAPPFRMRLVLVESPYRGGDDLSFHENILYARAALRDCLLRGESPIASHLLLTQDGVLDDNHPDERSRGINAGHAWMRVADAVVVYTDRGISEGMRAGITLAKSMGKTIEYRILPEKDDAS